MCEAAVDSAIMHDSNESVADVVKLPFIRIVRQRKEIQLINRQKNSLKEEEK